MFFRRREEMPPSRLKLVVGLGNIGAPYRHTRHNIGFEVVDEKARRHQASFHKGKFTAEAATISVGDERVLLVKPHTMMNLSGDAVAGYARFYKIPPTEILVVCDDVNLPLGKLRFRAGGSDGGHNGLWSIINRLGSNAFPRLRIGVGAVPPGMDMATYVLGHYLAAEQPVIAAARDLAADALETWITGGITAAMNRWNAGPKSDDGEETK